MSESASTQPPSDYAPDPQSPAQHPSNHILQASSQHEKGLTLPPTVANAHYAQAFATGDRRDPAIAYFENTLPSVRNLAPLMDQTVQPAPVPVLEPNPQVFLPSQSQPSSSVPLPQLAAVDQLKGTQRFHRLQRTIILKERRRFKNEREQVQTLSTDQKILPAKRKSRQKQSPKESEKNGAAMNRNCPQKRVIKDVTRSENSIKPQPPPKRRGKKTKNIAAASFAASVTTKRTTKAGAGLQISSPETSKTKEGKPVDDLQETNSKQNSVNIVSGKDSKDATEAAVTIAQERNSGKAHENHKIPGKAAEVLPATSRKVAENIGNLKQETHVDETDAPIGKDVAVPKKKQPAEAPSKGAAKGVTALTPKPSRNNDNVEILQNLQKKKIAALEKQVIELKWALLKSARPPGSENQRHTEQSGAKRVKYFPVEAIEIATITESWSRTMPENPPWEIRSQISASAQTRGQLSLKCLYNHVLEAIETGTRPPCDTTFRSLREGIISSFKAAGKADFAHTPQHATVAFAMSKMTQGFLNNMFSLFLKSPSHVDMSWGIAIVKNIIAPVLQYAKSESGIIYGDVSKCCAKAICDSALSLSTEACRPPHVQVELSLRAIELSTAILTTEDKHILFQIPTETVCAIGSRNILFSLRLAALKSS